MTDKEQIQELRREVKELYSIMGIMRSRPEYLKAVRLWRRDTGHNNLTYPDIGGHWAWALSKMGTKKQRRK